MSNPKTIAEMTTELVKTFLEYNQIDVDQLPDVILGVHKAMKQVVWDTGENQHREEVEAITVVEQEVIPPPDWRSSKRKQEPAVPIANSVTPDYIVCLEDGKRFKTMRHHLRKAYNMSPEDYRRKWGLAEDYPITAPNYTKARKLIANRVGLGSRIRQNG